MTPRSTGPRRFAFFARSALLFALGFPVVLGLVQGCATGDPPTSASTSSSSSSGQTGGMGGEGGNATTSSSTASSSTSSSGGGGGGFMPPTGTADYPSEKEVNDITPLANPFDSNTKGFTGSIYPIGDIDVFEVNVTMAGSALTVKISDGKGGCPAGLSSAVRVDGPSGLLAADAGTCPQLTPAMHAELVNLPVGKTYVQVESLKFVVESLYVVEISLEPPTCGNKVIQGPEQCDDGNTMAGDGCSPTCKLEGNYVTEVEPNQPLASANSITGADGAFASIMPVGDQDFFSFDIATTGTSVKLEVTDGFTGCPVGFDSVLHLYSPMGTEIISDDEEGVDSCSLISPALYPEATNLPSGKYTAMVEHFGNSDTQPSYVLKLNLLLPACGDGIRVASEQCDDGNVMTGDGCSATCMSESPWEIEPNNTQLTSTSLWGGTNKFNGAIKPIGDVDYFSFTLPAGMKPVLATHTLNNVATCPGDTQITLFDSMGATIATDNDGAGVGTCSAINGTLYPAVNSLPAGTYYVRVIENMNDAAIGAYTLDVSFQ